MWYKQTVIEFRKIPYQCHHNVDSYILSVYY